MTNHAVVAMVGVDVKRTRCTTCDAEHEYKHARVPRPRKKADAPAALYAQPPAAPKRVASGAAPPPSPSEPEQHAEAKRGDAWDRTEPASDVDPETLAADAGEMTESVNDADQADGNGEESHELPDAEEGPVHRPLIRATLPRPEGQAPPSRQTPEFTIRQPGGRQNRFRPRAHRGGQSWQPFGGRGGNVTGGSGKGGQRQPSGRQGAMTRVAKRHDSSRKRSK